MTRGLRARRQGDDDGFALIFVLLVITVITIGVASVLVVTASNIGPAKRSQDTAAAVAAAEAGLQRYLADLNASCASALSLSAPCSAVTTVPITGTVPGTDGAGVGRYTLYPSYLADGSVRVQSVGTDASGSRTLVADYTGLPSPLAYEYSTKYETLGSAFLNSYYKARTIALTNGAADKLPAGTTSASWNATTSGAPLGTDICDQLWYDGASSGRATLKGQRTTLTAGYDWGQTLVSNPAIALLLPCEVTFSTGMTFTGPVYTQDAPYLSNSTASGAGPVFNGAVQTSWSTSNVPPAPGAAPWRSFPIVGGQPSGTNKPVTVLQQQTLAPDAVPPAPACIYSGPTRIKLNPAGTMTITSPLTTVASPTSDPACYGAASISGGMVGVTVSQSVGHGMVVVANAGTAPASGWPATGTKSTIAAASSNSTFYLTSSAGLATTADAGLATAADTSCPDATGTAPCAWSEVPTAPNSSYGWATNTTTANCNVAAVATEEQNFACEYSQLTTAVKPTSTYATLRARVQNDLAAATLPASCGVATVAAATTAQLTCLLGADLATANTQGHASPLSGDHRYVAVAGAPATVNSTVSTGSAPGAPSSDSLFQNASGQAATETKHVTTTTFTVNRQTYGCHTLLALISCALGLTPGWAGDVKQFVVTITQTSYDGFTAGKVGKSYFPNTQDVTQYAMDTPDGLNGPGDLYVEGTVTGKMSLIAKNDLIVTGDVLTSGTGADALIAKNNVRIYHPVSCLDQASADITLTTAGYCPNDVTGLYTGGLEAAGALKPTHPSLQYLPISAAGDRTVQAAVFALNGSMLTDNYDRGTLVGNLKTYGTVGQLHRGATGVEWEIQSSDTSRPASGYRWQASFVNLSASGLPYVPSFQGGTTGRYWNIVSMSTGN